MNFDYREIGIEGIARLKWVASDVHGFNCILRDWKLYKDDFFKYIKKFDTIVQAGGHCGMYPIFYGNYFNNVYTFEPALDNFEALRDNCENISNAKYHVFNAALGDIEKNIYLETKYKKNTGKYHVDLDKEGIIPQITLDSLDIDNCDLIHLDIEGYELFALKGAVNTIYKFKPIIILETWYDEEKFEATEYMESLQYTAAVILKNDMVFIPK